MARLFTANGTRFQDIGTLAVGSAGTISVWIRPRWSSGDNAVHCFWDHGSIDSSGPADDPSFQKFSDNTIYAGFAHPADQRVTISDAGLFSAGVWANWVFTWSNANGQTLYRNGYSVGTAALTLPTLDKSFSVGNYDSGNASAVTSDSSLADYCRWDTILSQAEIRQLALGVRASQIRPGNHRIYLPLTESGGQVAYIYSQHLVRSGTIASSPAGTNILGVDDPGQLNLSSNINLSTFGQNTRSKFWPGIDALGWIRPRTASPSPGMVWAPRPPVRQSLARSFNGTSNFVSSVSTIDLSTVNKITVGFWLWQNAFDNNDGLAVEHSVNANNNTPAFFIDPNSGSFPGTAEISYIRTTGPTSYNVSVARPSAGAWHYWTAMFDSSVSDPAPNIPNVYIDGANQSITVNTHNVAATGNFGTFAMYLMSRAGASLFNAGKMADFAIWSRHLNGPEVQTLARGARPPSVRGTSLLVYWPLDGNSSDLSPRAGLNQTPVVSAATTGGPPYWKFPDLNSLFWIPKGVANTTAGMLFAPRRKLANAGGSRLFNGTSDVIDINSGLGFSAVPVTMAAWIKGNDFSGFNTILSVGKNSGGVRQVFYMEVSTGKLTINVFDNGGFNPITSSAATLSTGTTYHVAGVMGNLGPNSAAGYINGKVDGTGNSVFPTGGVNHTKIGGFTEPDGSTIDFFSGTLADVAIWNVALTTAEIASLANGARPSSIQPGKLVGYWPLDGYGAPANDLSFQHNNGILTGTKLAVGPPFLKKIDYPDINSLFWIPQTTGAAPPPAGAGLGALLSSERSRLINAGLILS